MNPTQLTITPQEAGLRHEVREWLLSLNGHAFTACIGELLTTLAYTGVRIAGRADWKGKNREGGYDIEAALPGALGSRRVVAAVKQFDEQKVFRATVDQLVGACLRVGAGEALLVTTGRFAPSVETMKDRRFETALPPVRLIDGEALVDLLISNGLCVRKNSKTGHQELNTAFFARLEAEHSGNRREDCRRPGEAPLTVSVVIESAGRNGRVRRKQDVTIFTPTNSTKTKKAAAP